MYTLTVEKMHVSHVALCAMLMFCEAALHNILKRDEKKLRFNSTKVNTMELYDLNVAEAG